MMIQDMNRIVFVSHWIMKYYECALNSLYCHKYQCNIWLCIQTHVGAIYCICIEPHVDAIYYICIEPHVDTIYCICIEPHIDAIVSLASNHMSMQYFVLHWTTCRCDLQYCIEPHVDAILCVASNHMSMRSLILHRTKYWCDRVYCTTSQPLQ